MYIRKLKSKDMLLGSYNRKYKGKYIIVKNEESGEFVCKIIKVGNSFKAKYQDKAGRFRKVTYEIMNGRDKNKIIEKYGYAFEYKGLWYTAHTQIYDDFNIALLRM